MIRQLPWPAGHRLPGPDASRPVPPGWQMKRFGTRGYPLVIQQFAIENGHRNSGFSH